MQPQGLLKRVTMPCTILPTHSNTTARKRSVMRWHTIAVRVGIQMCTLDPCRISFEIPRSCGHLQGPSVEVRDLLPTIRVPWTQVYHEIKDRGGGGQSALRARRGAQSLSHKLPGASQEPVPVFINRSVSVKGQSRAPAADVALTAGWGV